MAQFQFCFSAGTPFQDLGPCSLGCSGSPKLFFPHPTMRLSQAPGHCFQLSLFSPQGRTSTFSRGESRGKCGLTLQTPLQEKKSWLSSWFSDSFSLFLIQLLSKLKAEEKIFLHTLIVATEKIRQVRINLTKNSKAFYRKTFFKICQKILTLN